MYSIIVKRMIVLLLCLHISFSCSAADNGKSIIKEINQIIDQSLEMVSRLGRLGYEKVFGPEGGYLIYETRLCGINKVINTIDYHSYESSDLVISGKITNETDWLGSGISSSVFLISGKENIRMEIEMSIENRIRTNGLYTLTIDSEVKYIVTQQELEMP